MSHYTTTSIWKPGSTFTNYPRLHSGLKADVVVVGGGIAGLTSALLLQRQGKSVVLLERDRLGSGETSKTTAHLTEEVDARYRHLIRDFGREEAAQVGASSRAAINLIERFSSELQADCDFKRVPGFLYAESSSDVHELRREMEAAQEAGVACEWFEDVPLPFATLGGVHFPNQAQFHPLKYLTALAGEFTRLGGKIHEQSPVVDFQEGEPCRIIVENGAEVIAKDLVFTTNVPINNRLFIHTKIENYRTYAIAVVPSQGFRLPGLFWDNQDPYHYIRSEGKYLIIGGEDHKTGHDQDMESHFDRLIQYATTKFPVESIAYFWSGQVVEPADSLPYIGRNPMSEHVYMATGFSGNGMTFGTVAGMLISDLVLGIENEWEDLYLATRIHALAAAPSFVSHNADVAVCLVRDLVQGAEVSSVDEIRSGEGRILKVEGKKVAAFRDSHGHVSCVSAICTHMGCQVHFNSAETSWDCPCHGSRFGVDGRVLNGPAVSALEPVAIDSTRKRKHTAA